ncbi:unnamed protein product [Sympodiomycopsis kandeliae]
MSSFLADFPLSLSNADCFDSLKNVKVNLYPVALGLATLLAVHGFRKGSLSPSGAAAAFIIGYLTMANPFPGFGITLIVFYLVGSRITKVKADIKAKLEREEGDHTAHKSGKGGGRDAWQVMCNGLTGCIASVLFRLFHSDELPAACQAKSFHILSLDFISPYTWQSGTAHCSISPFLHDGWTRFMVFTALGHFACCAGDVFASELGILSKRRPVLVASFPPRLVPPGTNGGVSLLGTAASAAGGLLIGVVMITSLFLFNSACNTAGFLDIKDIAFVFLIATLSGLTGSMLDSILGALFQKTWYNTATKQVLVGRRTKSDNKAEEKNWTVITGYDVLSNNQVNFISSAMTAVGTALLDRVLQ